MSNAFESLSDIQKTIVFDKKGKFVVRACPGSGKTYSVAARLARLIGEWDKKQQGIAAISFTNAAWQEIRHQLETHFGIATSISYPHFLGTIDSFINQNIFLPFGHLALGCKKRPELVGEPYGPWYGKKYSDKLFDNITFNINDNLVALNKLRMPKNWVSNQYICKAKEGFLKAGFAIQHDADYYAMKLLEKYPQVAAALAYRYPTLIIDEAQDTSDIQMRIIDILISHGLRELMLVGDPDQAIFEWNDAKPQLFLQKYNEWREESIKLNENRRSSQKICDCTFKLSSLHETSMAVTEEVKDCTFSPIVITYDSGNINTTIEYFISLCHENGIVVNRENVAVIYRSKEIFNLITGIVPINQEPWRDGDYHTKDFAKGKYLFDAREIKKGLLLIEKAYIKMMTGNTTCNPLEIEKRINDVGFTTHRKEIHKVLYILPETTCSIGEWVDRTNEGFALSNMKSSLSINDSMRDVMRDVTFKQIFRNENEALQCRDYRLGTVHSVKGETFEAVLLFLKQKGIGKYYKTLIREGASISDNEELRIVYVGLTRPRKLLVLAVPDNENKQVWESKLLS
ncbi:MAG: ATP-dependent helicase [Candidatus Schekmanbacteria bacterium]|nr:ATP-dependent helicase [Candidatus Schekmanbacteria bacterium]